MNKVLLVFEDYNEMSDVQFALKKTGFDVVSIGSEFSISEEILSFNPEIVIGCGKGPKVTTVGVGRRLKEMPRWHGKVVLVFPAGYKPNAQDLLRVRMDMILEAPIESHRMIQIMAQLTDQDANELIERLIKAVSQEQTEQAAKTAAAAASKSAESQGSESVFVKGGGKKAEEIGWAVGKSKELDELNKILGGTGQERDQIQKEKSNVANSAGQDPSYVSGDSSDLGGKAQVTGGTAEKTVSAEFPDYKSVDGPTGQEEKFTSGEDVRKELAEAEKKLSEKVSKYSQLLQGVQIAKESTLKRVEAKKRFKELRQSWDERKLKSLDDLRREFTHALFKKK